jgi:hypothetical protein
MPRTEKRFGLASQPDASVVTEIVPTASTTRNVLINTTARIPAKISAAIYSGAYSNDTTGNLEVISLNTVTTLSSGVIGIPVLSTVAPFYLGRDNVYMQATGTDVQRLTVIDPDTHSVQYEGNLSTITGNDYWRDNLNFSNGHKGVINNNPLNSALTPQMKMVSSSKAIGIAGADTTSGINKMFDSVSINHTVGSSITESSDGVGDSVWQSPTTSGTGIHSSGVHSLQDGVGYIFHCGHVFNAIASGFTALGIYIYSNSSNFTKRAFWLLDGTSGKSVDRALSYFIASDYDSTNEVFAFSQPSTTTLWSGISPTSSTSWPAGYALPSEAAPAGFRIVSNSDTAEPDVNFLTGAITYPPAPTGVTLPTAPIQVISLKFSPDGTKLAVAYRRDYSGSGNTNSVVVVYTRQNDGTWLHTDSSGPRFPYQPHTEGAMAWSGDSGTIAIFSTTSSSTNDVPISTVGYPVYVWNVSSGSIGFVANSSVTSWTNLSSPFPGLSGYKNPKSGFSTVISVSPKSYNINHSNTVPVKIFGSLHWARTSGPGSAGQFIISMQSRAVTASRGESIQAAIITPLGTVGTPGVAATNYVTTVISDLELDAGETSQVSNIVLGSGESIVADASVSGALDISAHGVETT